MQTKSIFKKYKLRNERTGKIKIMAWLFPNKLIDEIIVNMEFVNGTHDRFIVDGTKEWFEFKDGYYVIDGSLKYWCGGSGRFELDYHQNFTSPIRREWDIAGLRDAITETHRVQGKDFEIMSTNPRNLKVFIDSKVVEGVMRGQQLQEFIKRWNLALLLLIILNVIHLIVYLAKSGVLKGLKFW